MPSSTGFTEGVAEKLSALEQANAFVIDALEQARLSLMATLPFMDVALWRLDVTFARLNAPLGTDGRTVYVDALQAAKVYQEEPNELLRCYLHAILHCVFRHPFDSKHANTRAWDLACDISVEASMAEMLASHFPCKNDVRRARALERAKAACPQLTASKLYRLLLPSFSYENGTAAPSKMPAFSHNAIREFIELFSCDSHAPWPRCSEKDARRMSIEHDVLLMPSSGNDRLFGESEHEDGDEEEDKHKTPGANMPGAPAPSSSSTAVEGEIDNPDAFVDLQSDEEAEPLFLPLEEALHTRDFEDMDWQDISNQIELDMESFNGKMGSSAGSFLVNLSIANRKHFDYRDFLKKFAARSEEMKVSTEEFDYIYYTFGLNRYKNMPLVEPLEYQESTRIRDFVIAIDTSASCAGALVQRFAEKTYDILKNTEGFGRKVNIHVVQCDCDIRKDVKITEMRDFERAFEEFSTRGYGGTDFRPVFRYVDDLIETKELTNLKGLIYFTDGLGKYPVSPPPYETAFIFVNDTQAERRVPAWAMKVMIDEEDIVEL